MPSFGNIWRRLKSSTGQLILCERKTDLIHPLPDLHFEPNLHLNPFQPAFRCFQVPNSVPRHGFKSVCPLEAEKTISANVRLCMYVT